MATAAPAQPPRGVVAVPSRGCIEWKRRRWHRVKSPSKRKKQHRDSMYTDSKAVDGAALILPVKGKSSTMTVRTTVELAMPSNDMFLEN